MLGRNYRFSVNNQCGVNVTVTIQARRWKFASDGSITFDTTEAEVFNESAIASSTTAWTEDTAIDNSSDKWIGADLEIVVTPAASVTNSATTNVTVQIQRSTDGGTTWPDDGRAETLGGVNMPTGSAAVTFQLAVEM